MYGVKLHLLCSTNRVPLSYELTPANVAEVRLTEELLDGANLGDETGWPASCWATWPTGAAR